MFGQQYGPSQARRRDAVTTQRRSAHLTADQRLPCPLRTHSPRAVDAEDDSCPRCVRKGQLNSQLSAHQNTGEGVVSGPGSGLFVRTPSMAEPTIVSGGPCGKCGATTGRCTSACMPPFRPAPAAGAPAMAPAGRAGGPRHHSPISEIGRCEFMGGDLAPAHPRPRELSSSAPSSLSFTPLVMSL